MTFVWMFIKSLFTSKSGIFIWIMLGLLALVIIPNFDQIREKFGFETRASLKADKANLKAVNQQLEDINKNNEAVARSNEAMGKIAENVAENTQASNKAVEAKITKVRTQHTSAVAKARQKAANQVTGPIPETPPPHVIQAVSEANITALWDAYNTLHQTTGA